MAYLDDYGNPITTDSGADWQPSAQPESAASSPEAYLAGDEGKWLDNLMQYSGYVEDVLGLNTGGAMDTGGFEGLTETQAAGGASISGPGKDNAATGTGDKGFIGGLLESFKKEWGGMGDRSKAAVLTVGAGLAAGLGKGYIDNKKLAIEEKTANAQTNLANTQAEIAQKKLENQKFGTFKFNPNLDAAGNPIGLIGTPAPFTPLKNRVTR